MHIRTDSKDPQDFESVARDERAIVATIATYQLHLTENPT
jgi:hypothetical protein